MITRAVVQTGRSRWEWFEKPREIVRVESDVSAVPAALEHVEALVEHTGGTAVGFLTYEAAAAFGLATAPGGPLPVLCFALFSDGENRPLGSPVYGVGYTVGPWTAHLNESSYRERIARIRSFLAAGETYQVNFTFPLEAPFFGDGFGFFRDMCAAQAGSYAAYLELDNEHSLLSASPELFLEREGDRIVSLPMKGTAARGLTHDADEQAARALQSSPKERAENLMITDMIRNDLGRIARPGSVRVSELYTVQRYPRVLQMVSRVEARSDARLATLMEAMFPCASITGAPKHRTMEVIRDLEGRYRGIYTGAIGVIRPEQRLRFNVAIRTVVLDRSRGRAEFGVGGGIVWDSSAEGEYEECTTKATVLNAPDPPVTLLETLRWNHSHGVYLLEGHLRRLSDSYRYFLDSPDRPDVNTIPLPDSTEINDLIADAVAKTGREEKDQDWRVRLLVDTRSRVDIESQAAAGSQVAAGSPAVTGSQATAGSPAITGTPAAAGSPAATGSQVAAGLQVEVFPLAATEDILAPHRIEDLPRRTIVLARWPVNRRSPWLYHKTTNREIYDAHLRHHPEVDDVLLYNQNGMLTESCFASVLIERIDTTNSQRYLATPPVREGLLPGVFREYLLTPPEGTTPWTPENLPVVEEPVPRDALRAVQEGGRSLYLVNSVRGWMRGEPVIAGHRRGGTR